MARVLVVEPDRQIREFIAGILTEFGHHVQQCSDAAGARHWLRRIRFDVLATDLPLAENGEPLPVAARHLPVLTLCGRPFHAAADKYERPPRLNDKPFRCADLHKLVAAIENS
jgi:DNA-binding response OmpR family regulator